MVKHTHTHTHTHIHGPLNYRFTILIFILQNFMINLFLQNRNNCDTVRNTNTRQLLIELYPLIQKYSKCQNHYFLGYLPKWEIFLCALKRN